jgi:mono/diheme cytochrome c family protein
MTASTRSRPLSRLVTALVAGSLAAGILAACGSSNSPSPPGGGGTAATTPTTTEATTTTQAQTTTQTQTTQTQTSTQQASAAGKLVFTQNCGSCHTLKDAGSEGQVGPNLDDLKPDAARVQKQVEVGGGPMPAFKGTLSDAQIKAVAAYVASTAGK